MRIEPVIGYSSLGGTGYSGESTSGSSRPESGGISLPQDKVEIHGPGETELTEGEQQAIEKLKAREREVKAHEQAHLSAAGGYAKGGATYEYQVGPDGKRYISGGEVRIDVSPESEPEATIRKMRIVRRAALAPVDPSAQDRKIAAEAVHTENQARMELHATDSETPSEKTAPA
ncbi:MAG: hypothetical protein KBA26_06945 [Candidatus Delongbacteria bacterium]|nr:hypothetical protein [Candidatus Delongbacteria bacterium]